MNQTEKVTKHRSTIAPFECVHCGHIWYGYAGMHDVTPDDLTLCVKCWSTLDNYLYALSKKGKVSAYEEQDKEKRHQLARAWIADKGNKPFPRATEKRFHSSVPQRMRNAIDAGLVKTNGNEVYIVYSQGETVVRVEFAKKP
ncbi:hypothetical protein [Ktedonospora formicarum]|uniref:Uncharacterized protein n=1 Tax=Ktedonospora formicarum TaxID=2778364 RepID=A0A8J3IHW2_9CHLR|nr:hypothetical protein [Ktedonospora formicarum]GHO51386.1 hypothetical protein KSX_95490 [Ktedonospora formicarum]GHO51459.1 hypothetical protein KSX_96220 [Ktedonospora formicarum]